MAQSKSNPPQVPSGWKAVFDDEYQTWYYVDLSTNSSQWEHLVEDLWVLAMLFPLVVPTESCS